MSENLTVNLIERVDRVIDMAHGHQEKYVQVQEKEGGEHHEHHEHREKNGKQTEDGGEKDERDARYSSGPDVEQPETVAAAGLPGTGGRTYYFTVPIRPLSGHIEEEQLGRLTLYYSLYGVVFAAVGAIAIVLPIYFGVAITTLLAWLLVLGGSITLLMFLLICGAPGTAAFLLLSALHLAAGLYLFVKGADLNSLVYLLAGWFVLHGVIKIVMAIEVRKITTWPVVLVSGATSIILAFVVLSLTSKYGERLIQIAFGADLAITGFALLLISLMGCLGKGTRSVTDADLLNEPFLRQAAASA